MFLTRRLNPEDLAKFHVGFVYYWDVYITLTPQLMQLLEVGLNDPIVCSELDRLNIDKDSRVYYLIKTITFMVYVLGMENSGVFVGDNPSSALCSLLPMVVNEDTFSLAGTFSKSEITTSVILTIIYYRAKEYKKDPKVYLHDTLDTLRLPGWLHNSIRTYLRKEPIHSSDSTIIH